jgi:hypothetical protein
VQETSAAPFKNITSEATNFYCIGISNGLMIAFSIDPQGVSSPAFETKILIERLIEQLIEALLGC